MATSLSNLVGNLAEAIYIIKCKDFDCFVEYRSVKENSMKYKITFLNKNYLNVINEELKKRFKNTFNLSNNVIDKFISLLRKDLSPYEYINKCKKFNETSLPVSLK